MNMRKTNYEEKQAWTGAPTWSVIRQQADSTPAVLGGDTQDLQEVRHATVSKEIFIHSTL